MKLVQNDTKKKIIIKINNKLKAMKRENKLIQYNENSILEFVRDVYEEHVNVQEEKVCMEIKMLLKEKKIIPEDRIDWQSIRCLNLAYCNLKVGYAECLEKVLMKLLHLEILIFGDGFFDTVLGYSICPDAVHLLENYSRWRNRLRDIELTRVMFGVIGKMEHLKFLDFSYCGIRDNLAVAIAGVLV